MYSDRQTERAVRRAICTAMAAALVAGCASTSPFARTSASQDAAARLATDVDERVARAERAVEKAPQDAAAREALAHAYLGAGRFESAITTFEDVLSLGDSDARIALSLALANVGAGRNTEAVAILDQWRDSIPASDLGLALALAGETSRGVAILADALRGGEDTPKLRQNLAYAYALDGRWREARLMAAQDVAADQLDARISTWATQGRPEDYRRRVAGLLGAPVRTDAGQPRHLALLKTPGAGSAAVAQTEPVATIPLTGYRSDTELPPVEDGASFWMAEAAKPEPTPAEGPSPALQAAPAPSSFERTFDPPGSGLEFTSQPVIQPIPAHADGGGKTAEKPRTAAVKAPSPEHHTHLVQLGSFSSPENAERAWSIFVSRHPELKDHEKVVTEAVVRGKTYWRVAAAGFDKRSARSMCSDVKGRGGGCIAYAGDRPLPGALPGRHSGGSMHARR